MFDKLYIIRHGETFANVNKIYMEHSDLTANGINQAKIAGEKIYKLKNELNFNNILVSPLTRAKDTAKIINEKLNLPIHIIPELSEGRMGTLEGKKHSDMTHEMWQKWIDGDLMIDGGQTFRELQNEIQIAFDEILKYENPLIVAHGGTFFQIAKKLNIQEEGMLHFTNCTLYCIENTGFGYRIFEVFEDE